MLTTPDKLSATFFALADPTRRAILTRLARGAATVKELAAPFRMSGPAVSKHLRVLERAGLLSRGRQAQWRPRTLNAAPLREVAEWAGEFRRSTMTATLSRAPHGTTCLDALLRATR